MIYESLIPNYKPIKETEMENTNRLTLKWGTLKRWDFSNDEKGKELLKEYDSIGSSFSAMAQRDTPRQKEIICELIDLCPEDSIYMDWNDEVFSRQKAKDYVMNYGKETAK